MHGAVLHILLLRRLALRWKCGAGFTWMSTFEIPNFFFPPRDDTHQSFPSTFPLQSVVGRRTVESSLSVDWCAALAEVSVRVKSYERSNFCRFFMPLRIWDWKNKSLETRSTVRKSSFFTACSQIIIGWILYANYNISSPICSSVCIHNANFYLFF